MLLSGCQLHCRWRTKSIRHKFYKCVCMWQSKFKNKKKEDDKIQNGRGMLPNWPISTCHSQFRNQTWLSTYFLFCFCTWKKKEGMACPVVSCHFILKHCELRGLFHPRIISTHYNIPSQSEPPQCKTFSVTLFLSSSSECFLLFRAGERLRKRACNCVCVCVCACVCISGKMH